MLLFGISVLTPTSTLLTALDYFMIRFPSTQPGFVIPLALNAPLFIFMVIGLFIKWFSLLSRAVFGLVGIICWLVAIPLIANYLDENTGWIILLITISIMGFCSSVWQNSIYGFAGLLPSKYMSAVMVGNGLSTIIFTVIRIICTLILPPDESQGKEDRNSYYGCLVFFIIGGLVQLLTIICALHIFNSSFAHFHLERTKRKSLLEELDEEDEIADGIEIEHKHMKERYIEIYKAVMYMALQVWFVFINSSIQEFLTKLHLIFSRTTNLLQHGLL